MIIDLYIGVDYGYDPFVKTIAYIKCHKISRRNL